MMDNIADCNVFKGVATPDLQGQIYIGTHEYSLY